MEELNKLVQTIIAEGNKKAKEIIDEANREADETIAKVNEREEAFVAEQVASIKAENEARLALARNSTIYRLNKQLLKEKNIIIDKVYELLLVDFRNLKGAEYEKFLSKVLERAEAGDEVNYSSRAGEAKLISSLPSFRKKNLKLGKVVDISGGVVLSNAICNKDFSFEGLIKEKRENSIRHTAELLFG